MADSIGSVGLVLQADISQFASDMGKASLIAQREMAATAQAQQQADKAAQKFIQSLKDEAATFGKTREEVLKYRAEQLGMTQQSQAYIDAIAKARKEQEALGNGLEHVGFQSAGAKRELLVLAHELSQGNYKRFAGSLMVIGERTNAMELAFSAAGIAILATGAVVAGFIAAIVKGAMEQKAFNNALTLTNNFAGQTNESFRAIAASAAEASGTTVGAARAIEQAFVSTGRVGPATLNMMTQTALEFERVSGQNADEVVKDFVRMTDGVTKWAKESNAQYHFLTVAQYEEIRALEEQGRVEEAERIVLEALHGQISKETQNLGNFAKAWNWVKQEASGAIDVLKNWGREQTGVQMAQTEVAFARAQVARAQNSGGTGQAEMANLRRAEENLRIAQQEEFQRQERTGAHAQAAADQERAIKASDFLKNLREQTSEQAKLNKELTEYHAAVKAMADAGQPVSAKQQAADEAAIRAKYNRKGIRAASTLHEQELSAEIKDLQGQFDHEQRALKGSLDRIKADYDEGLLNTKQFLDKEYEAKQAAIERQLVIVKQQEEIARGKKNIAAAEQYKNEEKKLLDQIETNFTDHASAVTKNAVKAQQAVTAYIESLNAQYATRQNAIDDSLGGIGLSGRQQAQQKALDAARRDYEQKAENLRKLHAKPQAAGGLSDEEYTSELAALNAYYNKRLQQEKDFNTKSDALRADWSTGEKKALADYLDTVGDVAGESQKLFTDSMNGMENALVSFATTGKLNFKSLADSIIADLARIAIRQNITGPLAKFLFSGAGGGGGIDGLTAQFSQTSVGSSGFGTGMAYGNQDFGGYFADGGYLPAGQWGIAGENGPEPIFGGKTGVTVHPNSGTSGGQPITIHNYYTVGDIASTAQLKAEVKKSEQRTIASLRRQAAYGSN